MKKKIVDRVNVSKEECNQVNFRLTNEELLRLKALEQQSGLKRSQIMKEFINNGEVNVRYDAKEVIGNVAMVHDKFNIYSHKVSENIIALKSVFLQIKEEAVNLESNLRMDAVLKNAEFLTEFMMREYMERRESAEWEIKSNVDIYSGK